MPKHILFVIFIVLAVKGHSQNKLDTKVNSIGISVPIIWNNSNGIYYSLGKRREPEGKSISYGSNVNYARSIYKNFFGVIGIGYFKQTFDIDRPFKFESQIQLLFTTTNYTYDNIHLLGGVGYNILINKSLSFNLKSTYNHYLSFRQVYNLNYGGTDSFQINHKSLPLGSVINFSIGSQKKISRKLSIGIEMCIPILTQWKKDEIFYEYDYSNDTQQIASNKFSIGTNISCNYHF